MDKAQPAHGKASRSSRTAQVEVERDAVLHVRNGDRGSSGRGPKSFLKVHPVDKANWVSFTTFSWISSLIFSSYRGGLKPLQIPRISFLESCHPNTDTLEKLWDAELGTGNSPRMGHVIWLAVRRRALFTSLIYLTSIIFGFLSPTVFMRKVLEFAANPNGDIWDGVLWVSLLILCEFARVFLFTLTWAMSYRTAIRLRTACMGLVYRKLLRLGHLTDSTAAKITNVISGDCARIYEVITTTQLAIGGPTVLVLCVFYIVYELGYLSLFGILVFPLFSPIQFLLAKGSGSFKRQSVAIRDDRITFMTQALHYLKFLKMFGWEKYYRDIIANIRLAEKKFIMKGQFLQSLNIVIAPTLPHVGAIITFLIYINSGHELTPAQAFCIVALFSGRIRPSLNEIRSGFRAYFDAGISFQRLQCFTILFLFSLFGYTIKSISQLFDFSYVFRIFVERMEDVLTLPEVHRAIEHGSNGSGDGDVIIFDNVTIKRRAPPDSEHVKNSHHQKKSKVKLTKMEKKEKKDRKKVQQKQAKLSSVEKLLNNSSDSDVVAFELEHINLRVKKGSFVGICGQVGSGKSTFLKAITGSLSVDNGNLSVFGGIAYAAQEPWLFSGTLRDNVTFGEPFEHVRYYSTINACCLVNDFGVLPGGDLTETSESGSNLSGGQKCRLSLARAIYHSTSRDIFLLDDPFSGLDGRVAKTVFERVITNHLSNSKSKTVLLVTHQLQYLKDCDEILVFSDGTIAERGTHSELMSLSSSVYVNLIANAPSTEDGHDEIMLEDSDILDCKNFEENGNEGENPKESKQSISGRGEISWDVYSLYLRSAGGYLAAFFVLLSFALSVGSTTFSSWWLKQWFKPHGIVLYPYGDQDQANQSSIQDGSSTIRSGQQESEVISSNSPDFIFNRNVYAGIIGIIFLTSFCRTVLFVFTSIRASQGLHCLMLSYFFRNRLKSSERVGTGQILNLFSTDMEQVDVSLPNTLEFFLQNIFVVIAVLILVTIVFPVFLIPLLILFLIFLYIRRIYNSSIRELKRFESEAKTPIFTRVKDTVNGLGTIRAFNKEKQMIHGFETLSDDYHSIFYIFNAAIRWLSIRLDSLAVSVTAVTAILILVFHGKVSAASSGLALSYAAQLAGIFQFTVRLATETEARFVSIERMKNFLDQSMPEEPELFNGRDERRNPEKLLILPSLVDINPHWPVAGHVKYDSVYMSYSLEREAVLRDLSFEAFPGQTIGIIGRTGSGKSSIGSALFRLTELKAGQILIDDVNVSDIPLSKLRNSLCVIPQEPAIFQHSIRFNLDPGNTFGDAELWTVLEKIGLKTSIDNLDSEYGLSQGQRQLLSIGRALLRRAKVVFVDEATSSVDVETAAIMDRLMAEEFKSSTVFIVAHRLKALSFCDQLLIMEDGRLRDFGPVEVITRKPEFAAHFEKFETIPLI